MIFSKSYLEIMSEGYVTAACSKYENKLTEIDVNDLRRGLIYQDVLDMSVPKTEDVPTHASSGNTVHVCTLTFVPNTWL